MQDGMRNKYITSCLRHQWEACTFLGVEMIKGRTWVGCKKCDQSESRKKKRGLDLVHVISTLPSSFNIPNIWWDSHWKQAEIVPFQYMKSIPAYIMLLLNFVLKITMQFAKASLNSLPENRHNVTIAGLNIFSYSYIWISRLKNCMYADDWHVPTVTACTDFHTASKLSSSI